MQWDYLRRRSLGRGIGTEVRAKTCSQARRLTLAARPRVVSWPPHTFVSSRATVESVVAGTSVEVVASVSSGDDVLASRAHQQIGGAKPGDAVVAAETADYVCGTSSFQDITSCSSDDLVTGI